MTISDFYRDCIDEMTKRTPKGVTQAPNKGVLRAYRKFKREIAEEGQHRAYAIDLTRDGGVQ